MTSALALAAALLAITRLNAVHALIYLVIALLAIAIDFYLLGAPFAAALEVIVYAGAIMVLMVFVIMMLNQGNTAVKNERALFKPFMWIVPGAMSALLLAELIFFVAQGPTAIAGPTSATVISSKDVGASLFGPYLLIVELASMLLTAGLVGAFHLARPMEQND